MIRAAKERAHFARRGVGVGRHDASDTVRGCCYLDPVCVGELVEELPIDVRHEVAEAVDAQHLANDHCVGDVGEGIASC